MALRNTRKKQQLTLETRQAQLFMQVYSVFFSTEFHRNFWDVIDNWDFTDADDFREKCARTVITVPLTRLKDRFPYAVSVVKLDNGPSISGMALDVSDGDQISVGTRVKGEFVKEGERTDLCFRPV
jgi:hypothetical protein